MTIFLVFLLLLTTLISTSFHFVSLGVLLLVLVLLWYKKDTFILVAAEAVFLALFGHLNLGLTGVMLGILIYLASFARESLFPNHSGASVAVALVLFLVWDIVFAVLI